MKQCKAERTLVVGDIHGHLLALEGALQQADYHPQRDRLICLGDYIDGWEQSFQVVERLIEYQLQSPFKNIYLMGNHDKWMVDFLRDDLDDWRNESYITQKYRSWMLHGGLGTYQEYLFRSDRAIYTHKDLFFDQLQPYYLEQNKLFIHAGFDRELGFDHTLQFNPEELYWDRSLFKKVMHWYQQEKGGLTLKPKEKRIGKFDKIYLGHSPTSKYGLYHPVKMGNVINLDQGCKLTGILSVWVDDTDTFVQYL